VRSGAGAQPQQGQRARYRALTTVHVMVVPEGGSGWVGCGGRCKNVALRVARVARDEGSRR